MTEWSPHETGKHQEHVIAHVVGASVLGYFFDEMAAHVALDIGFVWTIYVDGEMGLLPARVALAELDASAELKAMLAKEIDALLAEGRHAEGLESVRVAPVECLIEEVELYASDEGRRIVLRGEVASLAMETSLRTGEIRVFAVE